MYRRFPARSWGTQTILLAEGDLNEAFLIRTAFERVCPGVRVWVVSGGHEAFKYLERQKPLLPS